MATQTDPVRYGFPRTTAPGISRSLKSYAHQSPSNLVRVGVIGYGYWGPNVVRNLQSLENCQLVTICDKNSDSLQRASRVYPGVEMTMDFSELLTSPQIDAIAVVTPVWTHFELAKAFRVAKRMDEAREEVLLSLEAAPGFKPAQRLLLEIAK